MIRKKSIFVSDSRTDLGSALDSDAIRATSYLRADLKAPLLVYVEDREDIPFWQVLFSKIEGRYSGIHITILKDMAISGEPEIGDRGQQLEATGKDILFKVKGLGANKVIAVDRDYDGIIDNYHTYTNKLRTSPYIITTTYYSIENHIISPKAVNTYLQRIVGTEKNYEKEFQNALVNYNSALDPALLLLLVCLEKHATMSEPIRYAIKGLSEDISDLNNKYDVDTMCTCLDKIRESRGGLLNEYSEDIQRKREWLSAHSKYPESLWKVVQGHILYAFACNFMSQIVKAYGDAKVAEFHATYGHGPTTEKKVSELKNRMYSPYSNYSDCVFYKPYDNPVIDFSDDGIVKIINKIESIH